jgi:hypothetical protein
LLEVVRTISSTYNSGSTILEPRRKMKKEVSDFALGAEVIVPYTHLLESIMKLVEMAYIVRMSRIDNLD